MKSRILSIIFVTIIAVLVWVLAEGLTVGTGEISADLQLDPGSNTRAVRIAPGDTFTGRIELTVRGSSTGIDQLTRKLRDPITLTVGNEIPFEPGEQLIDLQTALRASEVFKRSGVTLTEVKPRFVRIEADDLVTVEVPVRVALPDVQTEAPPRTDPETISYTLPRAVKRALDSAETVAVARLTDADLAALTPGTEQRLEAIRVQPSPALAAAWSLAPANAQVAVILTVRSRTATETIPTVPVQILVAPTELERFHITVAEDSRFLHDVTLKGPSPLIERIRSDPALRPVAVVSLSFEDLEKGIESKDARLVLPPGFEQVEARADAVAVRLTIQRREPVTQPE
jgi:hypothetical protein